MDWLLSLTSDCSHHDGPACWAVSHQTRSWPADWLLSFSSDLPHHYRLNRLSGRLPHHYKLNRSSGLLVNLTATALPSAPGYPALTVPSDCPHSHEIINIVKMTTLRLKILIFIGRMKIGSSCSAILIILDTDQLVSEHGDPAPIKTRMKDHQYTGISQSISHSFTKVYSKLEENWLFQHHTFIMAGTLTLACLCTWGKGILLVLMFLLISLNRYLSHKCHPQICVVVKSQGVYVPASLWD